MIEKIMWMISKDELYETTIIKNQYGFSINKATEIAVSDFITKSFRIF